MGAFLAGFLLAATPFRYQLTGQLAPLRDLLMAVFFVAVGLGLDRRTAIDNWWVVLIAVPMVIGLKALIAAGAAWSFGMAGPVAVMSGVVLAQTGEFTLVVLAAGVRRGLVSGPTAAIMGVVVGVTLMLTPGLPRRCLPALGRLFVRVPTPPWAPGGRRATSPSRHPGASSPGSGRWWRASARSGARPPTAWSGRGSA